MLKYSLGSLFLVVTVVGLGCAALANPTELWAEVIVGLTLLLLFAALVAALLGQGRVRIFAIGFAAVGWLYFLLTFSNTLEMRNQLITSRPVNWIFTMRMEAQGESQPAAYDPFGRPPPADPFDGSVGAAYYPDDPFGAAPPYVAPQRMSDIGHALWTLIFACAGGVFGQFLRRGARRTPTDISP